jgi:cell division protein FtsI/penicillin-binding protein 2
VLPVRDENLQIMQEAMFWVTNFNRGTARFNIRGIQFDTAGKTGTAESGSGLPHAWFAGYTLNEEERTGKPHIAIAVIVENIGQGSDYAVPIFRYMVEAYYFGSPGRSSYDFGISGSRSPHPRRSVSSPSDG